MTISELVALLGKVNQIAGDIPVAVKAAEGGVESVLESVDIHVPALEGGSPAVHLTHRPASPDPASGAQGAPEGIPGA